MSVELQNMKRVLTPDLDDGNEQPAKLQRGNGSGTVSVEKGDSGEHNRVQGVSSLNDVNKNKISKPERGLKRHHKHENETFQWIPPPSEEFEDMNQPRSRPQSIFNGRRRTLSVSSDSIAPGDNKSSAYKDPAYVTILELKGCFMHQSPQGPIIHDIELCRQLLDMQVDFPEDTMFNSEFIDDFYNALRNRSETRLLLDLHPLIMPSAENQFIEGKSCLEHVIDGYNDSWYKTDPIYGPRPRPVHAQGLKWSTFSESQRRKLGIKPNKKSPYAVREDMYFPYLTAEIKCGNLELADRQNMHSMCVALRAVVTLSQVAGCPEKVHRRLLGFSISHDHENLHIYGYYPEFTEGRVKYFRLELVKTRIWMIGNQWACYRFVQNLDRLFVPIHTKRLMDLLAQIPEPSLSLDADVDKDTNSQMLRTDSQGRHRAASSQSQDLQLELSSAIQTLQQQ